MPDIAREDAATSVVNTEIVLVIAYQLWGQLRYVWPRTTLLCTWSFYVCIASTSVSLIYFIQTYIHFLSASLLVIDSVSRRGTTTIWQTSHAQNSSLSVLTQINRSSLLIGFPHTSQNTESQIPPCRSQTKSADESASSAFLPHFSMDHVNGLFQPWFDILQLAWHVRPKQRLMRR